MGIIATRRHGPQVTEARMLRVLQHDGLATQQGTRALALFTLLIFQGLLSRAREHLGEAALLVRGVLDLFLLSLRRHLSLALLMLRRHVLLPLEQAHVRRHGRVGFEPVLRVAFICHGLFGIFVGVGRAVAEVVDGGGPAVAAGRKAVVIGEGILGNGVHCAGCGSRTEVS